MRGLLKKDLAIALLSKRTIIIFAVLAVMFLFTGSDSTVSFAVTYFSMICGMQVLTTITYDEFDHSMSFLMTLPINRKTYVLEKYVFGILSLLAGWTVAMVVSVGVSYGRGMEIDWIGMLAADTIILVVLIILILFMIPVQIKFGGEKGRIVLFSIIMAIVIAGFAVSKLIKQAGQSMMDRLDHIATNISGLNPVVVTAGGIILLILAITLSIQVSMLIINKKEW